MVISTGSRQCIIKLKEYSDKKVTAAHRIRVQSRGAGNINLGHDRNSFSGNLEESTSQLSDMEEDHSLLGRLLNCKPCRKVTDHHKTKLVD